METKPIMNCVELRSIVYPYNGVKKNEVTIYEMNLENTYLTERS
jgi:hypothetical protein